MSTLSLFLMTFAMAEPIVQFDQLARLEQVPDDQDLFLEQPISFDVDAEGNYYLVDGGAKIIFSWDKNGTFLRTIGTQGSGPGEFVFSGRGRATAFVTVLGDQLYVMDGAKREILVFSTSGDYEKTIDLDKNRGRYSNFAVTKDQNFLIQQRLFKDERLTNLVKLVDPNGKTIREYANVEDESFQRGNRGGKRRFTIRAFYPLLVSQYNEATDELMVGNSAEPFFNVYDKDGKTRKINVPTLRAEVTKADKDEYELRFQNGRGRSSLQIEYPDKKPFYDRIVSLGADGYLVYNQSPFHNNINGVHLSADGTRKGRFKIACGQDGGLLNARGRVLRVTLNEEGEFTLAEIAIKGGTTSRRDLTDN